MDATHYRWDDLPREGYRVTLIYRQRRVVCRLCGIRTEPSAWVR